MVRNKQRFVRKLRILTRNDFWDVSRWLAGAYASSSDHLDQHKKPVLIRDHKIKWLDFGTTPDEGSPSPHPGFAWMKAGYGESIEWRKVRLTKQRNVDLTTDGLWAMPLNSGWVPVKSRRLQDWQKLKKYVPNKKHGDVCPNGVPALPEKDSANDDSEKASVKHSVHVCVPTLQQPGVENRANTRKFGLDAQKYRQLPPANPCISELPSTHRFQKIYTYPPLRNEILVLWTKNGENPENTRICSALAYSECPREIYIHIYVYMYIYIFYIYIYIYIYIL